MAGCAGPEPAATVGVVVAEAVAVARLLAWPDTVAVGATAAAAVDGGMDVAVVVGAAAAVPDDAAPGEGRLAELADDSSRCFFSRPSCPFEAALRAALPPLPPLPALGLDLPLLASAWSFFPPFLPFGLDLPCWAFPRPADDDADPADAATPAPGLFDPPSEAPLVGPDCGGCDCDGWACACGGATLSERLAITFAGTRRPGVWPSLFWPFFPLPLRPRPPAFGLGLGLAAASTAAACACCGVRA